MADRSCKDPIERESFLGQVRDHLKEGSFAEALGLCKPWLVSQGRDPKAQLLQAKALAGLRQYKEAIAELVALIRQEPKDIDAYLSLGEILYQRSMHVRAKGVLEVAARLEPSNRSVQRLLALVEKGLAPGSKEAPKPPLRPLAPRSPVVLPPKAVAVAVKEEIPPPPDSAPPPAEEEPPPFVSDRPTLEYMEAEGIGDRTMPDQRLEPPPVDDEDDEDEGDQTLVEGFVPEERFTATMPVILPGRHTKIIRESLPSPKKPGLMARLKASISRAKPPSEVQEPLARLGGGVRLSRREMVETLELHAGDDVGESTSFDPQDQRELMRVALSLAPEALEERTEPLLSSARELMAKEEPSRPVTKEMEAPPRHREKENRPPVLAERPGPRPLREAALAPKERSNRLTSLLPEQPGPRQAEARVERLPRPEERDAKPPPPPMEPPEPPPRPGAREKAPAEEEMTASEGSGARKELKIRPAPQAPLSPEDDDLPEVVGEIPSPLAPAEPPRELYEVPEDEITNLLLKGLPREFLQHIDPNLFEESPTMAEDEETNEALGGAKRTAALMGLIDPEEPFSNEVRTKALESSPRGREGEPLDREERPEPSPPPQAPRRPPPPPAKGARMPPPRPPAPRPSGPSPVVPGRPGGSGRGSPGQSEPTGPPPRRAAPPLSRPPLEAQEPLMEPAFQSDGQSAFLESLKRADERSQRRLFKGVALALALVGLVAGALWGWRVVFGAGELRSSLEVLEQLVARGNHGELMRFVEGCRDMGGVDRADVMALKAAALAAAWHFHGENYEGPLRAALALSKGTGSAAQARGFALSILRLKEGNVQAARTEADQGLSEVNQGGANLFLARGMAQWAAGELEGGRESFESAIKREAKHVHALLALARWHENQGDQANAAKMVLEAEKAAPASVVARIENAALALRLGRGPGVARASIEPVFAVLSKEACRGELAWAHLVLSQILREEGQEAQAKSELDQAQTSLILGASYHSLRARALIQEYRLVEAQRHLEIALQREPTRAARLELARVFAWRGEPRAALDILMQEPPRTREGRLLTAKAYLALGNAQDALRWFSGAQDQAPTPEVRAGMALARLLMGSTETANAEMAALLRPLPSSEEGLIALAELCNRRNRAAQALKVLEALPLSSPLRFLGLFQKALALSTLEQRAQAEEALQECLKLNAFYLPAHQALGLLLYDRGDYRSALKHLRQVVRVNPEDQKATFALMDTLVSLQEVDKAESYIGVLAARRPDDKMVTFYKGVVASERGAYDKALQLFGHLEPELSRSPHLLYQKGLALLRQAQLMAKGGGPTYQNYLLKALENFKEATSLDRNMAKAFLAMGDSLRLKGGDPQETMEAYKRFLELSPFSAEAARAREAMAALSRR